MHILTATSKTQGARDNDYSFTTEGELVWVDEPCATDRRDPDGDCGCGRGFTGLSSHRATTTAEIRDLELSHDDVMAALIGYYASAGYGAVPREEIEPEVIQVLEYAAQMPVGTILERRLDQVRPRGDPR